MYTTEAEYIECSEATREARSLVKLHRDLTGEAAVPPIYGDSNGALSTIRSGGQSSIKSKHIDIKFHVCRDLHARRKVAFTEISTHENAADIMAKSLAADKHQYVTTGIGLCRSAFGTG